MSITPQMIDNLWILTCAGLVCLMQAGFLCLESGLTRSKNAINVALKNLTDFSVSLLLFWAFGFGLMFGASANGWFGTTGFLVSLDSVNSDTIVRFLFQAMFCATAATIVSGAVSGRMRFGAYVITAVLASGVIYPLFGHWAWGSVENASGWLATLGFVDFAGATVVHSVGGWVALAAVVTLGPRIGRFSEKNLPGISGNDIPIGMLGVVLLWVGWIGFNGGSTMAFNEQVAGVIGRTFIAGAAGMLTGLVIGCVRHQHANVQLAINGSLAGLVAITASCHCVNGIQAVAIGAVGTAVMAVAESLLLRFRIDDTIGAVPVHAAAGSWGTLAVAIFGDPELLGTNLSRSQQFIVQASGVLAAFVFAFGLTAVSLRVINRFYTLRVSAEDEKLGLNIAEHGASTETNDLVQEMERQRTSGDFSSEVEVELSSDLAPVAVQYNRALRKLNTESERAVAVANEADVRRREAESAMQLQTRQSRALAEANQQLELEMAETARLHAELIEASHHAGMAEVATGILHNVGNVLNSINVSTDLIEDRLAASKTENLKKSAALFTEHENDLAEFLTDDARGQLLPGYICRVAESLSDDRRFMETELKELRDNLAHIKEIIQVQQSQARNSTSREATDLRDLVESAIKISAAGHNKHDVNLICDLDELQPAHTNKHKILQVLINLITNAKNAIVEYNGPERDLTVRMRKTADAFCQICVVDTGCGISPENLEKIFVHGFTTREKGHGFGLHSSALAVTEVGGRLTASSAGLGHGATFCVEFPMQPESSANEQKSPGDNASTDDPAEESANSSDVDSAAIAGGGHAF